jgi:lysophospholipase L1-like esterase
LSPAQQQAAVAQVFAAFQAKEATLLTELRTQLPGASLILLSYYNPYAAVPGNPFAPVAGPAIQGLNQIIAGMAAAFGARYVDIYTPFVGHEADYTFITTSGNAFNVHPNALGYAAIDRALGGDAGVLAPTPAPEPGSLTLLAGGLAIGIVALRRRRSA